MSRAISLAIITILSKSLINLKNSYKADKLHKMVLNHVANSAVSIVIGGAVVDTNCLGHGDLDVVDMVVVPLRLEDDIGEAQRHQVLHRRLAEVVVDAEGLAFVEDRAHGAVDLLRAGQVVAQRLLQHHAHLVVVQPDRAQLLADLREQVRAGAR